MLRNTTSGKRILAGLTPPFELADKTGLGGYGVVNDAGVVWRPGEEALTLAILTRTDRADASEQPRRARRRDTSHRRGLTPAEPPTTDSEPLRPRPVLAELVVGVQQPAGLHREAAAADASGELAFELFDAEATQFELPLPAA